MPIFRYTERDVRTLLARLIPVRWPAESLVMLTGCERERLSDVEGGSAERRGVDHGARPASTQGFLGVTDERLVYQPRAPGAFILRAICLVAGILAISTLVLEGQFLGFLVVACIGLVVALGVRVAELTSLDEETLTFGDVLTVDHDHQRIVGVARGGLLLLRVPDPAAFASIAGIVGQASASAA
jgi:hypothetical protein